MYGENSLRSATPWHYADLHRIREVVLPAAGEFTFLARDNRFFENLKPKADLENASEPSSSSSSVAPEQEATPAESAS